MQHNTFGQRGGSTSPDSSSSAMLEFRAGHLFPPPENDQTSATVSIEAATVTTGGKLFEKREDKMKRKTKRKTTAGGLIRVTCNMDPMTFRMLEKKAKVNNVSLSAQIELALWGTMQ